MGRQDRPGPRGGSCRAFGHLAVGAEAGSGQSPFRRGRLSRRVPGRGRKARAASQPARSSPSAQWPGGSAGGGWSAGPALRANEWAPGGRARSGLKGIRTVRIAPRSCLSLSPPRPPATSLLFLLCRTEQLGASENKQLGLRAPPPRPREHAGPGPHPGRPSAHHEEDPRQCHRHPDRSLDPGHFLLLMAGQPSPRSILRRPGRAEGRREAGAAPRGPHHPAHCEYAPSVGLPAWEPRRASSPCAAAGGAGPGQGLSARCAGPALYMLEHSCPLLWQPLPGGGAGAHRLREGDRGWGLGESAASLVGPACARGWERGGFPGSALPGPGVWGLQEPRVPRKAAGPSAQRAGCGSHSQPSA